MQNQLSTFEQEEAAVVTGYEFGGGQIDRSNPRCLAKESSEGQYWIRYHTYGAEAGRMVNPTSSEFQEHAVYQKDPNTGTELRTKFRKVTAAAFELYKRFLETRNPLHLRHAERELLI